MDTSGIGNSILGSLQAQTVGASPTQRSGSDSDGDNDGSGAGGSRRVQGHGRGAIFQALQQTFQALGLSPTQAVPAASGTQAATATDSAGSPSPARADLRTFFHALFDALRSQQGAAPDSATTASQGSSTQGASPQGSSSQGSSFQSALGSLISQVSGGTAPTGLQDAFNKLVADFGAPATGAATSTSTDGTAGTSKSPDASALLSFLQNLSQDVGYGPQSSTGQNSGEFVQTTA